MRIHHVCTSQIAISAARSRRRSAAPAASATRRTRAPPSRSETAERGAPRSASGSVQHRGSSCASPVPRASRSGRAGCPRRRRCRWSGRPAAASRTRERALPAPRSSRPSFDPKCRSSVCLVTPAARAIASSDACSHGPERNASSAASSSAARVCPSASARATFTYLRADPIHDTNGNAKMGIKSTRRAEGAARRRSRSSSGRPRRSGESAGAVIGTYRSRSVSGSPAVREQCGRGWGLG